MNATHTQTPPNKQNTTSIERHTKSINTHTKSIKRIHNPLTNRMSIKHQTQH